MKDVKFNLTKLTIFKKKKGEVVSKEILSLDNVPLFVRHRCATHFLPSSSEEEDEKEKDNENIDDITKKLLF